MNQKKESAKNVVLKNAKESDSFEKNRVFSEKESGFFLTLKRPNVHLTQTLR